MEWHRLKSAERARSEGFAESLAALALEPVIDGTELGRVERELGVTLPDPLLAYVAARVWGAPELGAILEAQGRARELRVSSGWIAFEGGVEWDRGTLRLFSNGTGPGLARIARDLDADEGELLVRRLDYALDTESDSTYATFESHLMDEYEFLYGAMLPYGQRPPATEGVAPFKPRILEGEARVRRVEHSKFGAGIVIGQMADTLEIDFAAAGRKKLKASFVRELE